MADLRDLEAKVAHAMELRGARYIHIFGALLRSAGDSACRRDHASLRAAGASETGIFPVFEAEHGEVTRVTKIRRRACRSTEYLRPQKRFAHLFGNRRRRPRRIAQIQADRRPQHPRATGCWTEVDAA